MNTLATILLLARRGLRQHALSSVLAALLVALALGGWLTVWTVRGESRRAFAQSVGAFDAVLGARGSPLQLVLAALFHLESPPGLVPPAAFEELRRNPAVARALPLAMGDNYQGWRVVGATVELLREVEWQPGRRPVVAAGGRLFDPRREEAVVGSLAARRLGLRVGDRIRPNHGLDHSDEGDHDEDFVVVGILEPTGTPVDRVIWIPLTELQHLAGHDPHAAESVSAVLVQLRPEARALGFQLERYYNREGKEFTFAWPVAAVLAGLFERFAWFDRVLELGVLLAAAMATGCVLVALHGAMSARRRDWAILRALGARRRVVLAAVLVEAGAIGLAGSLAGGAIYAVAGRIVAGILRANTGVLLDLPQWSPVLLWAPAAMSGLCLLAGLGPAWRAHNTPVADTLEPLS